MTRVEAAPRTSLTVREAAAAVLAELRLLESEMVPLDAALGRVLATDVVSPLDLPPWDNASMDGYAVRAADVRGARHNAPVALPVTETIAAGGMASRDLAPGTAMRIMTGAPVPRGADSVIRVEDTDRGDERVLIVDPRDAGRNVRPRGEEAKERKSGHKARRWVVEAAHSWLNRFRKLLVRYEKKDENYVALIYIAFAITCWRKVWPIYG